MKHALRDFRIRWGEDCVSTGPHSSECSAVLVDIVTQSQHMKQGMLAQRIRTDAAHSVAILQDRKTMLDRHCAAWRSQCARLSASLDAQEARVRTQLAWVSHNCESSTRKNAVHGYSSAVKGTHLVCSMLFPLDQRLLNTSPQFVAVCSNPAGFPGNTAPAAVSTARAAVSAPRHTRQEQDGSMPAAMAATDQRQLDDMLWSRFFLKLQSGD